MVRRAHTRYMAKNMSIIRAFDGAAHYDRFAVIQRTVARDLARHIRALPLKPRASILEIGCGTGFLGAALVDHLPGARWCMTDISPAMVARAGARFADRPDISLAVMDGSAPDRNGPFDLICSSLAMQWFDDLPAAIARLRALLAPDGCLIFTTLAAGSFAEWRAAHGELAAGTPDYPGTDALAAMGLAVHTRTYMQYHADGRAFLRGLKAIGAHVPRPGHRPLGTARLRDVLRRFEAGGATARYVVATCAIGALEQT